MSFFFSVVFYVLNLKTYFVADDYNYHYIFGSVEKRVSSITDVFVSQYHHYQVMNGRSVAHFFAQLFLLLGKDVFNLINTVNYLLLMLLIMWHIRGDFKFSWRLFTIINLVAWLFIPAYGQTMLWLDGAANYLLMTVLILLACLPFRLYFNPNYQKKLARKIYWLLLPLLAFFAGWASDNTSGGFILLIMMTMIYLRLITKKNPPVWMFLSLLSSICGFLIMALSPAQFLRLDLRENLPFLSKFLKMWDLLILEYGVISLVFIGLCLIYIYQSGKDKWSSNLAWPVIYYLTSVAIFAAVIIPGEVPERANFGSTVFMIIALISLVRTLLELDVAFKVKVTKVMLVVLISVSSLSFAKAYRDIARSYTAVQLRIELINEQKEAGLKNIEIPAIKVSDRHNGRYGLRDVVANPADWPNNKMAWYYGVESIVVESK